MRNVRETIWIAFVASLAILATTSAIAVGPNAVPSADAADRGYRLLVDSPFLSGDFDEEVVANLWQAWPEPLRRKAEAASPEQRRKMTFDRYGLTPRPDDPSKPLQYVVGEDGTWTMNCLSCHGGSVYGKSTPGAPNNRFALQTLTEEVRSTKFRIGSAITRMDMASLVIPLGTTHGTTNAVVFGMGLMSRRDSQLNVVNTTPQSFVHHDMDAPPWWHFHRRPYLYIDGFAQKGHRGLMQFMLIPENGRDFFLEHEDDFRDVYAFLSSLRAPKYTGNIDSQLAERGKHLFEATCAECHGTYGDNPSYPNRCVPIEDVDTDPVRLTAFSPQGRQHYADSWFAHAGEPDEQQTVISPDGYVAPPLDGVWASPPYFHNGSVPTLWHVLNPSDRPEVWRRVDESMDEDMVGFKIEETDRVPLEERDVAIRRSFFDTRRPGKSNQGHDYGLALNPEEQAAVLEYLKTL